MSSWYLSLRRWLIDICITLLERDLYNTPVKEMLEGDARMEFFATLFEIYGFKEYLVERETRFVHALAGEFTPEVKGQRAENLILFHKARTAHEKKQKRILSLRRATDSTPVAVPSDELVTN